MCGTGTPSRALQRRKPLVGEPALRCLLGLLVCYRVFEPVRLGLSLFEHVHVELGSVLAYPPFAVLPQGEAEGDPRDGYRDDRRENDGYQRNRSLSVHGATS
jgi:hypothetical protein